MEINHQGSQDPGGELPSPIVKKKLLRFRVFCATASLATRLVDIHDLEKRVQDRLIAIGGDLFANLTRDEDNITVKSKSYKLQNSGTFRVESVYFVDIQEGVELFRKAFPVHSGSLIEAGNKPLLCYVWPQEFRAPRTRQPRPQRQLPRPQRQLLAFALPGVRQTVSSADLQLAMAAKDITLSKYCRLRGNGVNLCSTNDMLAIVYATTVPPTLDIGETTVYLRHIQPAPEQVAPATSTASYAAVTGAAQPYYAIQAREEIKAAVARGTGGAIGAGRGLNRTNLEDGEIGTQEEEEGEPAMVADGEQGDVVDTAEKNGTASVGVGDERTATAAIAKKKDIVVEEVEKVGAAAVEEVEKARTAAATGVGKERAAAAAVAKEGAVVVEEVEKVGAAAVEEVDKVGAAAVAEATEGEQQPTAPVTHRNTRSRSAKSQDEAAEQHLSS
jgi:hypothetical protein